MSELKLSESNLADECVDVITGLVVSKLTSLNLWDNKITHTGAESFTAM